MGYEMVSQRLDALPAQKLHNKDNDPELE